MPRDSWFHVPKVADRVRRESVRVIRGDERWTGSWTVENGDLLVVSAYGSRTAPAGSSRDRAARAEAMLGEIVDARRVAPIAKKKAPRPEPRGEDAGVG